jgi:hypothetical protein
MGLDEGVISEWIDIITCNHRRLATKKPYLNV